MGDQITDLSERLDVPPVPLKTYQWEDIRRQKLEGRYPWTHLYKPRFDKEKHFESKEHEYEPVIPMNAMKNTSSVPALKITADKEICTDAEPESPDMMQDKRHLCIPDNEVSDESDEDDSDEITAEELQQRLEERYFKDSASSGDTKPEHEHEYERSEARSVSSTSSHHSRAKSDSSFNFHDRMPTRADKLKRKLKDFKEHIAKERRSPTAEGTPRMKRKISDSTKKAKPVKKNKFNFRKRNAKSQQESHSSDDREIRSPRTSRRRFSLPRLPSFSRSRSNSVKERAGCERSQSSEADSRKFFSYPRMFNSCTSKKKAAAEEAALAEKVKARSAPPTPSTRRQSPFSRRWVSKFIDHKREDKSPTPRSVTRREESGARECVVVESIFISLHEDSATNAPKEQQRRIGEEAFIARESTDVGETAPSSKVDVDDANFIFISLHEERFPEKLKQLEEEEEEEEEEEQQQQQQQKEIGEEEREIEKELQQARTARKFHSMLKRMQNDCKARACRAQAMDDKPEPVVITEVTDADECADQLGPPSASYDIEQPTDEPSVSGQSQRREFEWRRAPATTLKATTFREQSSLSDDSLETGEEATNVKPARMPRSRRVLVQDESRKGYSYEADSTTETKTYIKADLERPLPMVEHDYTTRHFVEYERALEKSRSQLSFEIENNFYSNTNSLARMETPVRPARPTRVSTLAAKKKRATTSSHAVHEQDYEYYELDASNVNYRTFPAAGATKPDKPRRKFRQKRTHSNSTTATETRSSSNADELEDDTINSNIVNAKQLSVSFLPLSSNLVGEPIVDYNLRETSSMIHLNLSADPPLPPKRTKSRPQNNPHTRFSSLPNRKYEHHSKGSSTPPQSLTVDFPYRTDATDMEYANDDVSSTGRACSPPKRPHRRRNNSLPGDGDGGGMWREAESLSSAKAWKDTESRTTNDYAVIETPANWRQEGRIDSTTSIPRRISRRLSDFFTMPRLRAPTNYVPQCASQTLDNRRCPSPSRPPRRRRLHQPPNREHLHSECVDDFNQEEEHLDFRLATERETPPRDEELREVLKSLQTHDIFERMKSRPLPPPPRPTRKAKEDQRNADYSECVKRKPPASNESACADVERGRAKEVDDRNGLAYSTRSTWHSWERKTTVREFEIGPNGERRELPTPVSHSQAERGHTLVADRDPPLPLDATAHQVEDDARGSDWSTRYADNESLTRRSFCDLSAQTTPSHSNEVCPATERNELAQEPTVHHIITAAKLNVSELNVGRMNVSEIDSSRLITSNVESSSMQLNDVRTETGHVIVNSVHYSQCMSTPERCQLLDASNASTAREGTPMSNEDIESAETASVRSRISSMVPEIGSEDECAGVDVKVRRPNRRKHQTAKRELVQQQQQQQQQHVSRASATERNHATLPELMSQILRICYSSVGEALNSLFESIIPEDREKRNEVHAAIWVITIIVAGCLMLGLQSNEKVVHHHHWDFHFPPPH